MRLDRFFVSNIFCFGMFTTLYFLIRIKPKCFYPVTQLYSFRRRVLPWIGIKLRVLQQHRKTVANNKIALHALSHSKGWKKLIKGHSMRRWILLFLAIKYPEQLMRHRHLIQTFNWKKLLLFRTLATFFVTQRSQLYFIVLTLRN